MQVYKLFNKLFTEESIKMYYIDKIQYTSTAGRDKVNKNTFNKYINENIKLINRKIMNGTYKFSSYKEILISKGRDKSPRVLSMPTIRDKIVLGIVKEILLTVYDENIDKEFIKTKIDRLAEEVRSTSYDTFIKIDMQRFYDTIDHDILLKVLNSKVRKKEFISLIDNAISTPTLGDTQRTCEASPNTQGVPQGLSISNILASIYLSKFDKSQENCKSYSYYRYVDDILILCNSCNSDEILDSIISELKVKYKLEPHELCDNGKTCCKSISEGFSYLGYQFNGKSVSIRLESIRKLERSIEQLFGKYQNDKELNKEAFVWLVNLRITGAVYGKKSYGWMYFYSQIDDLNLLYHLDDLIDKFSKRYNIKNADFKRFVRTYWEIRYKRSFSNYIPNFDKFDHNMKVDHLISIAKYKREDIESCSDDEVDRLFRRSINKKIKDIEKDIQNRS